jgi:hypothetical protein
MVDAKAPKSVRIPLTISVLDITAEEPLEPWTPKETNPKVELQYEERTITIMT